VAPPGQRGAGARDRDTDPLTIHSDRRGPETLLNRSDLLEQLKKVSVILSQDVLATAKPSGGVEVSEGSRSRWLRDRFSAGELQAMADLYRSGAPAREVTDRYGVGARSVKRLLHSRGVRRRPPDIAS
jgi:hypothetical protein